MTIDEREELKKFLEGQEIHRQRELERKFMMSVVDARREELKRLAENGIKFII